MIEIIFYEGENFKEIDKILCWFMCAGYEVTVPDQSQHSTKFLIEKKGKGN